MGYYSEEAETAGCGEEMGGIGNCAVDAVGVDVFDCADVVGDGFMTATCAVTDGAVDTTCCDSIFNRLVSQSNL